jgi:uncharacterized protein YgiM (DUF1202 family)
MKTLIPLCLLIGLFCPLSAQETEAVDPLALPQLEEAVEAAPAPESIPAPEGAQVTVVGDRVNLRNEPTLESDVISQASYGDIYSVVSTTDLWVEILPPDSVNVWAYGPLLFEDREVRAPEMNVRAGPGTQFPRLGEMVRGTPVTVLESLGEWRRIETPETVTLWISRDFVQLPPSIEQPARPAPTATPAPVPTPVTIVEVRTVEKIVEVPVAVEPTPDPKITAPEQLDLVPLRGQGTPSSRRGEVKSFLLRAGSPSRFVLRRENGTSLCYLLGDEEQLRAMAGSTVLVRGRDFWVTGEELPVMEVRGIQLLEEDAGE